MVVDRRKFTGLAVAFASLPLAKAFAQPAKVLPLKVAIYPGALFSLSEYVGDALGLYKAHGLDATLIPIASGPEHIAAVASGSVDVSGNTIGNMILANTQGQDLVILANNYNKPPYTWLAQPEFATPHIGEAYPAPFRDLKNARIGISVRGSEVELYTRVILTEAGLDPNKDVVWVPVGFGQTSLAAFEAKQIDVMVCIDPVQSILLNQNKARAILDLRDGGGPELFRGWWGQARISSRPLVAEKTEAMKRYVAAQQQIIELIRDQSSTDKVVEIYSKKGGLPLELCKLILSKNREAFDTTYDCRSYPKVLEYLKLSGQLKADQVAKAPDCTSFAAPGFASFFKS